MRAMTGTASKKTMRPTSPGAEAAVDHEIREAEDAGGEDHRGEAEQRKGRRPQGLARDVADTA